jgi:hypothetical protein
VGVTHGEAGESGIDRAGFKGFVEGVRGSKWVLGLHANGTDLRFPCPPSATFPDCPRGSSGIPTNQGWQISLHNYEKSPFLLHCYERGPKSPMLSKNVANSPLSKLLSHVLRYVSHASFVIAISHLVTRNEPLFSLWKWFAHTLPDKLSHLT